jgi:molecular chaperone Hsp33
MTAGRPPAYTGAVPDPDDERETPEDEIIRGVLTGSAVRVVAAITTATTREAVRRHQAESAAAVGLGRGITAGLLLATLTKDDERVTLQVLGDGPLGGLTVDATSAGAARAYVKHPDLRLPLPPEGRVSLAAAVGQSGLVSVIRDVGLGEPFSGRIGLDSGEIDEDVERYLEASEQIASALACDVRRAADGAIDLVAGILVQALPGTDGAAQVAAARALLRDGGFLRAIGASNLDAMDLVAVALGAELGPIQILDRRPVRFHCPCSRARAGSSLALLGEAELSAMILDDGKAEVTCNFCRARYEFDEAELEVIRRETARPAGPPS